MGDFYHNRIILIAVLLAGMGPASMVGLLPSAEGSTWELGLRLQASDFLSVNELFQVELPDPVGSATIYVSGYPLVVTHDPNEFSISMKASIPYTEFFDCVAEVDFSGSAPITTDDQGKGAFAMGLSLENHSKFACFFSGETPDVVGDLEITGQFFARTFFDTSGLRATIVAETTGEVEVRTPLGTYISVEPGFVLWEGWTLITGPNSSATVVFDSGSEVRLKSETAFVVEEIGETTRINQIKGFLNHMIVCIREGPDACRYYRVRTRGANVAVRGTEFSTEYSQVGLIGTSTVEVQSGNVEVTDRNGNTTVLTAGQQLTITDSVPRVTLVMPVSGYSFIQGITNILSWTAFDEAAGYLLELAVDPPGFSQPNSPIPEFPGQTALVMPGEFNQSDGLVEWPVLELSTGLPLGPQVQWRIFPVDAAGDILPGTTSSDAFNISQFTLTVNKVGTGNGTVTSSPVGIDCGAICTATFAPGTSVTLTATPAVGSLFAGFSGGGCSGTGPCTVTMNTNISIDALYTETTAAAETDITGSATLIAGGITIPIMIVDEVTGEPVPSLSVALGLNPEIPGRAMLLIADSLEEYPLQFVVLESPEVSTQATTATKFSVEAQSSTPLQIKVRKGIETVITNVTGALQTGILGNVPPPEPDEGDFANLLLTAVQGLRASSDVFLPPPLTGVFPSTVETPDPVPIGDALPELLNRVGAAGTSNLISWLITLPFETPTLIGQGGLLNPSLALQLSVPVIQGAAITFWEKQGATDVIFQKIAFGGIVVEIPLPVFPGPRQTIFPENPNLTVTATDSGGAPLSGGSLELISKDVLALGIVSVLDTEGNANIPVPVADYTARVGSAGFFPTTADLTVPVGGTFLRVTLEPLTPPQQPVASVTLSSVPDLTGFLPPGTPITFEAIARDANGNIVDCPGRITFNVSNPVASLVLVLDSIVGNVANTRVGPDDGAASVTATCGNVTSNPILVSGTGEGGEPPPPPPPLDVDFTLTCPGSLQVGQTGTCTITLSSAQTTVTTVPLTSSAPGVLTVPTSVSVPANETSATFTVTGMATGTATITAGPVNGITKTATVSVTDLGGAGTLVLNYFMTPSGGPTVTGTLAFEQVSGSPAVTGNYHLISDTGELITSFNPAGQSDTTVIVGGVVGPFTLIFTIAGPLGLPGSGQLSFAVSGNEVTGTEAPTNFIKSSNDVLYTGNVTTGTFTPQ